jgi:hypothetical protein
MQALKMTENFESLIDKDIIPTDITKEIITIHDCENDEFLPLCQSASTVMSQAVRKMDVQTKLENSPVKAENILNNHKESETITSKTLDIVTRKLESPRITVKSEEKKLDSLLTIQPENISVQQIVIDDASLAKEFPEDTPSLSKCGINPKNLTNASDTTFFP